MDNSEVPSKLENHQEENDQVQESTSSSVATAGSSVDMDAATVADPPQESVLEEAKSLMAKGKRLRALDDVQSAADCLEQACQLFDVYYGVGKRECADAYLEYGLALTSLANLEAGNGTDKILKKAGIEEDPEEEDDEDEDDEEEESGEEDQTNNQEIKGDTNGGSKDASMEDNKIAESESSAYKPDEQQPGTSAEPAAGTSNGTNGIAYNDLEDKSDEEAANEEPTTIEIAWEVLCLARGVFQRDESMDGRLKLAETLQKLGEISIEWENNENAVSILEESLLIRKAILPNDHRLVALTYYHLGLAHSFKQDTPKANENFQNAVDVIERRIKSQTVLLEAAKFAEDTVAIAAHQTEINELKDLIPDMVMRLDDTKDDDAKNTEVLKRQREEIEKEEEDIKKVCSDKSKPVDDISHLVKRKAT